MRARRRGAGTACGVGLGVRVWLGGLVGVSVLGLGGLVGGGCASQPRGPYQPLSEAARRPAEAERLTLQAAALLDDPSPPNLARAEALLREALTLDLYHGPAHNNLGVVYLHQNKLYEAAGELEWAKKLLPGHPDPRTNLALVLDRAGRLDDALASYQTAVEIAPADIAALQGLTELQLRSGRAGGATRGALKEIALRGDTEEWRAWAREQLAQGGE